MAFKVDLKSVMDKAKKVKDIREGGGRSDRRDVVFYNLNAESSPHTIRFFPAGPDETTSYIPNVQENIFAFPVFTHYRIPGAIDRGRCIRRTYPEKGVDCPICTEISEFEQWVQTSGVTPDEVASMGLGDGGHYVQGRAYTNIINRNSTNSQVLNFEGKEINAPQIYMVGLPLGTVYNTLIMYMAQEDFGDFTDPENGFDVLVNVANRTSGFGRDYTPGIVPRQKPLDKDPEVMNALIKNMTNVGEMFGFPKKNAYDNIVAAAQNIKSLRGRRAVSYHDTAVATSSEGGTSTSEWSSPSQSTAETTDLAGKVASRRVASKPGCYSHHSMSRDVCMICVYEAECKDSTEKLGPTEEAKEAWYSKMAEDPSLTYQG